jgi:hypothetical protein
MTIETHQREAPEQRESVIHWLLDSDPSIRWQVMLDLMDESEEIVDGERSRVAALGWGARLLDLQAPDGQWGGSAYVCPGWTSTTDTLRLLRDLGLERRMFRSRSSGAVIDSAWTQFSFPTRWHYDVLRGLDYLRMAGVAPDQRVVEAVELVERKRDGDGRWPLENPHAGEVHFDMEGGAGKPSRWNTLRALRVLDWYSARG